LHSFYFVYGKREKIPEPVENNNFFWVCLRVKTVLLIEVQFHSIQLLFGGKNN
jgi:hypothetical protein